MLRLSDFLTLHQIWLIVPSQNALINERFPYVAGLYLGKLKSFFGLLKVKL